MNAGRRDALLRAAGWVALAALVLAAGRSAWKKGGGPADATSRPEWSYYQAAVGDGVHPPLELHRYGYLPGITTVLKPFMALPHPWGLGLFLAVGLASAAAAFLLAWKLFVPPGRPPSPWAAVWLGAAFYLALQNNQLVAPMAAMVFGGLYLLRRHRVMAGGALLGGAALLKTLPLTLGLYLLLKRRLGAAVAFGAWGLVLALGAAALAHGPGEGLSLILEWPGTVSDYDPVKVLDGDPEVLRFFGDNQSPAAWVVRAEPWLGETAVRILRQLLLWGSLGLAGFLVLRPPRREGLPAEELALWLAWTAFASPYGRYYYCLLLVPAWLVLTFPAADSCGPGMRLRRAAGMALPVLAWGTRTDGVFALLATFTLGLVAWAILARPSATVPRDLRQPA